MPRKPNPIPSYYRHKASGQAFVRLDGRDVYLGKHDTEASRVEYRRVVAEYLAAGVVAGRDAGPAGSVPSVTASASAPISVAAMALAFWKHAQGHYHPSADGSPSGELGNVKASIRPLNLLYGEAPGREFGPKALRAVRERMIRDGLARPTINARVNRIRHIFKWAASHELIPVAVHQALATVEPLARGRTTAPEPEGIRPVPRADVDRTVPHLTRPVAGMVRMQLLTGMRPGEVCMMRGGDINKDGATWTFRPATHKNAHRGKGRDIALGPQAQALVAEYARADPDAYLFDPRDAGVLRGRAIRAGGKHRRYSRAAYLNAIRRACLRSGVSGWSPNQLRHTFATEIRASHGLEAAQVILGHSRADTTQIYAERDLAKAREVIARVG